MVIGKQPNARVGHLTDVGESLARKSTGDRPRATVNGKRPPHPFTLGRCNSHAGLYEESQVTHFVIKPVAPPEISERFQGRLFTLNQLEQRGVRITGRQAWYLAAARDWQLKLEPAV